MLASDTFAKESSPKRNQISFLSGVDSRDGTPNLCARLIRKQFSLAKISIFVEGTCRSRWMAIGTDCRVLSSFTARQEVYSSAARAQFVLCRGFTFKDGDARPPHDKAACLSFISRIRPSVRAALGSWILALQAHDNVTHAGYWAMYRLPPIMNGRPRRRVCASWRPSARLQ